MLLCVAVVSPHDTVNPEIEEVVEGTVTRNLNSDYEEGSRKIIEVAPNIESEETSEVQKSAESSWSREVDHPETLSVR